MCLVILLKLEEFWSPDTSDPSGVGTVALLGTLLNLPFGSVVRATSREGEHGDRDVSIPCAEDSLSQGHRINPPRPRDKGPQARRLKQQHFYHLTVWRPEVWDGGVSHQVRLSRRLSCWLANGHLIPEPSSHTAVLCVSVLTFFSLLEPQSCQTRAYPMASLSPITSSKALSPNTVRFWGARGQSFNMWIWGNTTRPTSHHIGHFSGWCPSPGSTLTSVTFYELHLKTHLHPGQAWVTMETGVLGLPACLPSYHRSDLPVEVWILTSRIDSHEEKL